MVIIDDKETIRLYRDTNDNRYLELLLEKYKAYILKVTYNIFNKYKTRYSYDDCRQEVTLEFIRIVKTKFNVETKFTFFTYMHKVLRLASLNFVRDDRYYPANRSTRIKQFKGNVTFFSDITIGFEEGQESEDDIIDLISKGKDEPLLTTVEKNLAIENVKNLLTKDEYKLICDYIVKEETQTSIARRTGINQTTISKNILKILEKIEESIYLY